MNPAILVVDDEDDFLETYRRLRLDSSLMNSIEGVLQTQLEHHLDRRLKSLAFLNQLRVVQ